MEFSAMELVVLRHGEKIIWKWMHRLKSFGNGANRREEIGNVVNRQKVENVVSSQKLGNRVNSQEKVGNVENRQKLGNGVNRQENFGVYKQMKA